VAEGEADGVRILFWGTPDFALPSFRALLGEDHDIVGVVTQPDRPAGRGRRLHESPVKQLAREEFIPILQPERVRGNAEFMESIRALEPDLSVVIAYGQILPREILELPCSGSINVHASLLPELRGAAPINWAIIRGYEETGITIMRMAEEMDAGPILLQVRESIAPDERASDLWTRLSELGAAALVETLALLEAGVIVEIEQEHKRATFAPRLTRGHAHVDWTRPAVEIDRLIRGLDETPGAWNQHGEHPLKLFRPRPDPDYAHDALSGTVLVVDATDPADGILVAAGEGAVWIREVQPAGKRRMTATEWVRGRGVSLGDRLT